MELLLIYAFVALGFSFYCSIAEAVLLCVTPSYVLSLIKKRPRSGKILKGLKDDIDRPLAAILSLNTIAHTVGAVGVGAQAAVVFGNNYVGIASAILTLFILVFSEIIPKTIGATYWRQLAPMMSQTIRFLITVLLPLVWLSELITKIIARNKDVHIFSREEFTALAEIGKEMGQLKTKESLVVKNLFRFQSLQVKDIMTPRTVICAFREDITVEQFFAKSDRMPFSRLPVYKQNQDDITGFVLKSDIFLAQAKGELKRKLLEYKREIRAIPSTSSLFHLFETLLDSREHIALVVDEYGGTEGLVTLEDVIETLLGLEIVDEADTTVDMQALARSQWQKRARSLGIMIEENEGKKSGNDATPVIEETDGPPCTE